MLALLLMASFAFARGKADFDKFLKTATDKIANYNSDKYYEKLEFSNSKTNEKKKFVDFDEIDRRVYILLQLDLLSRQLEDLHNKWKEELKNAEETPDDANEASKKDVTAYLEKLLVLRKQNAAKTEELANELFKKFPDKFTKEEKDQVLKTMKEYHDKSDLIKRDK
jgi:hypothetical protein